MILFGGRPPLLKTVNVDELRRDVDVLLHRLRVARQATKELVGGADSIRYYGRGEELAAVATEQIDHVEAFLRKLAGYGDGPLVRADNPFSGENPLGQGQRS